MLKSLRKFNKNVFVYPPPLSYQGRGYLAVCVLTGRGELRGGDMYVRLVSHVRGALLNYKEREFRGGGLNLVFPGDPPPPYQITSVLDMIC